MISKVKSNSILLIILWDLGVNILFLIYELVKKFGLKGCEVILLVIKVGNIFECI